MSVEPANREGRGEMTVQSGRGRCLRLMPIGAVFVVLLQIIPSSIIYAVTVSVAPTNLSVLGANTQYSDVDATGYETLSLSFGYNAEKLEAGDTLLYGWKTDTEQSQLGSVEGKTESGLAAGTDETGTVNQLALPSTLADTEFQVYFQNTGTSSGTNDQVDITSVSISGDSIPDTIPPEVPVASPLAGVYNTQQSVTLSASDDSSLPTLIYYTTDGSTPDQTSQPYTNAISVGADMTIKAIAYDATGNASEIATFSYIIDKVVPTIQNVQYSNNNLPTNSNVTVTITASEPVETPDGWTKVDDTTFTKEYSANTPDSVSVRDIAGNVSEASTIDVKGIDKATPTIAIDGNGENGIYSSAINYAVYDDVSVKSVTINGIEAPWNGSIASSGTYTITVVDTANNTETITITIAIPIVLPVLPAQTPSTLQLLSPRSLVSSSDVQTLGVDPSTTSETPQRTDVSQANIPDVISTAPGKDITLAPSEEGWKLWGIAWYWYATIAGLAGAGWWLFGRKYFIPSKDEF